MGSLLTKSISGPNILLAFSSFLTWEIAICQQKYTGDRKIGSYCKPKLFWIRYYNFLFLNISTTDLQIFELSIHFNIKKVSRNTITRTGNPFFRKMSTTLLPTPPVAPATRTIPEVSMAFTGLLGDGLDSFSIRNSKNFTIPKYWNLVSKWHLPFLDVIKIYTQTMSDLSRRWGSIEKI